MGRACCNVSKIIVGMIVSLSFDAVVVVVVIRVDVSLKEEDDDDDDDDDDAEATLVRLNKGHCRKLLIIH